MREGLKYTLSTALGWAICALPLTQLVLCSGFDVDISLSISCQHFLWAKPMNDIGESISQYETSEDACFIVAAQDCFSHASLLLSLPLLDFLYRKLVS